jgi:uncharacterized protein YxeA
MVLKGAATRNLGARMLVGLLILLAILVAALFYRQTRKAGRELELLRIQSQLAALSRSRRAEE